MSSMSDGSAEGLLEFLDWLRVKGLMKPATANAYKSATSRILAVDGEDWATTDVRSLDVDSQLSRFENLAGHEFTPGSLSTYNGRFRRAVEEYVTYLESPSTYKPGVSSRQRQAKSSSTPETGNATHSAGPTTTDTPQPATHVPDLVEYAFPMRSGEQAFFRLPPRFGTDEVDRMSKFLAALAIDLDEVKGGD